MNTEVEYRRQYNWSLMHLIEWWNEDLITNEHSLRFKNDDSLIIIMQIELNEDSLTNEDSLIIMKFKTKSKKDGLKKINFKL